MDVVLIILGILGFGAIIISAYIFTVAARNYVSDDDQLKYPSENSVAKRQMAARSASDRRSGQAVTFPLTVNGMLITQDRRQSGERRSAA